MDPLRLLVDPLAYPFMVNGLLETALLAVAAGLVGPFVVHRNLTFFAHALAHTVFPALVLAAVLRASPTLGAALGALVTVAAVFGLRRASPEVRDDSAVGITFIGLFALGVVLVGLLRVRSANVAAAVTGNLLGVGPAELATSALLVLALLAAFALLHRPLVLSTFDPLAARALGLPVALLDLVLLAMVAGTAIVGVGAVGVILPVAVLVTPAATAQFWGGPLGRTMLVAALAAGVAGVAGLYIAYYLPVAPAAVLVLALGACFAASALLGPRGLLGRRRTG
ncbi:MAG: metal ABC transporter permease [Chloroflexi bacterium]|nr:metal ABC transporter permease [Chloroflexota bacterium]